MSPEQFIISRQISYHPHFKWQVGMLAIYEDPSAIKPLFLTHPADARWVEGRAHLDITDPSTIGVLLNFLSEEGVQEVVKAPLSKESFGLVVARVVLKELEKLRE